MGTSNNVVLPGRSKRQDKKLKNLPTRVARRHLGRKVDKYSRYRARVGKPRGPGVPGAKSGKNRTPR